MAPRIHPERVHRKRVPAAGFILTGGQSRRLGRDKALLELAGQPLLSRTIAALQPLVTRVTLVGAPERYAHLGVPALADGHPGRGPLAGIVTALAATDQDWNLVVACDLPYLEPRFLKFLLEAAVPLRGMADAVVPQTRDTWQPLCAAYHRRCLAAFERVLATDHPKVARAFSGSTLAHGSTFARHPEPAPAVRGRQSRDEVRVRALGPQELERFAFSERMFKNINTPEDYAEAQRALER